MFFVLVFEPRGYVMNTCHLKHLDVCKLEHLLFITAAVLFCLQPARFLSHEHLVGKAARGKGRILLEAWAIPDSHFFAVWLLVSYVNSPKIRIETYLACFQRILAKNGTIIFRGCPP
jgi:hypothetical protein